jgi:hypothetical protein
VPAFSAVYADQVILFSRAYRGGPTKALADRMKAAQSLVFGEQLGWVDPGIIRTPAGAFLRQCAQTRYALRDYLAHGRMLRVPQLDGEIPVLTADWQWSGEWPVSLPTVQTGAWRARDGRVALVFANFGPSPVTARYRMTAEDYGLPPTVKVTRRLVNATQPAGAWRDGQPVELTVPAETVLVYELAR